MQLQPSETTPEAVELHALCTQIRQLMAAGNVNQHGIGQHYNHAVKHQLAEKAGYKNAQEYFSQNIKELSRATLAMYGAVARVFNAEVCALYGMSALSLLITYSEASARELDPVDPSTLLVEVPQEDGAVEEKYFGECTVAELRKALQRLRRPTSSAPLPAEVQARVQQCRAVWADFFPERTGIRLELHNRKGKPYASLKDIPLAELEQLMALLNNNLRPARAA